MRTGFNRLQVRSRQAGRAFEVEANWDHSPSLTSSQHRHIRFQLTLSIAALLIFIIPALFFSSHLQYVYMQKRNLKTGAVISISCLSLLVNDWWMHCNHDARIIFQGDLDHISACYSSLCVCVQLLLHLSLKLHESPGLRARLSVQRTASLQRSDTLIWCFSFIFMWWNHGSPHSHALSSQQDTSCLWHS